MERLSESGNILAGLQPKTLDISGSEIRELWKEASYPIETLDIRGCEDLHFEALKRFLHLKELVVMPGQLTTTQLKSLPSSVMVSTKDLN